jgi:hypothetical protein
VLQRTAHLCVHILDGCCSCSTAHLNTPAQLGVLHQGCCGEWPSHNRCTALSGTTLSGSPLSGCAVVFEGGT